MAKAKRNSRNIGANWEREVGRKLLGEWTGLPWVRTPGSGGWNKKHAPSDLMPKEPRDWPILIECKSYDSIQLQSFFAPTPKWTMIDSWMEQMLEDEDAHGGKLLKIGFFKQKRSMVLCALFVDEASDIGLPDPHTKLIRDLVTLDMAYMLFDPKLLLSMNFETVLERLNKAGFHK